MARVLLLFGGRSSEHEVSCTSAVSVSDALVGSGHRVIPVGIDREGQWFLADTAYRPFRAEGRSVAFRVPEGVLSVGGESVEFDVIFPVLHGPMGEDGTVQGLFEMCDTPYVGCGVLASALCMDKDLTKGLVSQAGFATSLWRAIQRTDWDLDSESIVSSVAADLRFPLFVKPSAQGSSVGISKVTDLDTLTYAIANAFRYDTKVVVEEGIVGREIEVGVLDGPRASLPGEIVIEDGWYTYQAKYEDDTSECVVPADLTEEETKTVRGMAESIFDLLGLTGLARIDFFYDTANERFLFNEANTMPGFTSISGFPRMWIASGLTYEELCTNLVDAAFVHHEERGRLEIR
ncbi:MAG: D-alanine--D-alanine ligase [Acidimicrobiia bacterium]|nr:D-alanine--D-alanine ligase [Acidimicrobiia bacterium]